MEVIPEDDSVTSISIPFAKQPTVIVEGIPLKTSSPVLVESVLEDEESQFSLLQEELRQQHKDASKTTQAVLDQFKNLIKGTKIDDKSANMMTKLVLAQKSVSFSPISTDPNNTTMGKWMDKNKTILRAAPWDINGVSIVDMEQINLTDAFKHY